MPHHDNYIYIVARKFGQDRVTMYTEKTNAEKALLQYLLTGHEVAYLQPIPFSIAIDKVDYHDGANTDDHEDSTNL